MPAVKALNRAKEMTNLMLLSCPSMPILVDSKQDNFQCGTLLWTFALFIPHLVCLVWCYRLGLLASAALLLHFTSDGF